jgi:hypothetical protein
MDETFEPALRAARHGGVLHSPSLSELLPPVPEWPDLN